MNIFISEHIDIYDLHIRDCAVCLYCTGYAVLSWSNFSSTGVLNLMYSCISEHYYLLTPIFSWTVLQ